MEDFLGVLGRSTWGVPAVSMKAWCVGRRKCFRAERRANISQDSATSTCDVESFCSPRNSFVQHMQLANMSFDEILGLKQEPILISLIFNFYKNGFIIVHNVKILSIYVPQ